MKSASHPSSVETWCLGHHRSSDKQDPGEQLMAPNTDSLLHHLHMKWLETPLEVGSKKRKKLNHLTNGWRWVDKVKSVWDYVILTPRFTPNMFIWTKFMTPYQNFVLPLMWFLLWSWRISYKDLWEGARQNYFCWLKTDVHFALGAGCRFPFSKELPERANAFCNFFSYAIFVLSFYI